MIWILQNTCNTLPCNRYQQQNTGASHQFLDTMDLLKYMYLDVKDKLIFNIKITMHYLNLCNSYVLFQINGVFVFPRILLSNKTTDTVIIFK